jgi:hypothetical protein
MDMMTVENIGDEITSVIFSGRLDSIGAASVSRRFNDQVSDKRAVIVDLSDVDYVASLAIRFLVTVAPLLAFLKTAAAGDVRAGPIEAGVDELYHYMQCEPAAYDRTASQL